MKYGLKLNWTHTRSICYPYSTITNRNISYPFYGNTYTWTTNGNFKRRRITASLKNSADCKYSGRYYYRKCYMVSPTTLLVVGITVVASFVVPTVDMSLSIRLLIFPMLFLANAMGIMGIATGYTFLIIHLSSLENFGVPYMD